MRETPQPPLPRTHAPDHCVFLDLSLSTLTGSWWHSPERMIGTHTVQLVSWISVLRLFSVPALSILETWKGCNHSPVCMAFAWNHQGNLSHVGFSLFGPEMEPRVPFAICQCSPFSSVRCAPYMWASGQDAWMSVTQPLSCLEKREIVSANCRRLTPIMNSPQLDCLSCCRWPRPCLLLMD